MILIFQERLYFIFSRNANQAQQFQNHYDKHLLDVGMIFNGKRTILLKMEKGRNRDLFK